MNIFYTSKSVHKCALNHCVIHLRKMIVEYSQLLSTAIRMKAGTQKTVYVKTVETIRGVKTVRLRKRKVYIIDSDVVSTRFGIDILESKIIYLDTHHNHPCAKWVRESSANHHWLLMLLAKCIYLYTNYIGPHSTASMYQTLAVYYTVYFKQSFNESDFTEPPKAMPEEFKCESTTDSYERYLDYKYQDWTSRPRALRVEFIDIVTGEIIPYDKEMVLRPSNGGGRHTWTTDTVRP